MPGTSQTCVAPREEHCHLLVLDPTHTRILAARPVRSWLLPHLKFRGLTRQPRVLTPYLAHIGVDAATPIHEALLCNGLGLDHGCGPDPSVAHRYVALEAQAWRDHVEQAHDEDISVRGRLTWEPIAPLLREQLAVLPVQETAVRTCLERLTHAVAPFDSPAQLRAAKEWVREHLDARGIAITGEIVHERRDRFDMVLRVPTSGAVLWFKGGPRRMMQEVRLTEELHRLMPDRFAETIAIDTQRHWWLTSGTPGRALSEIAAASRSEVDVEAVHALAATQRQTLAAPAIANLLANRRYGAAQHQAVAARVIDLLSQGPYRDKWPRERLSRLQRRMHDAGERLMSHGLPASWTPGELVAAHLFQDDDGRVRFAGVEDSYLAPPTLALLTFVDEVDPAIIVRLEEAYVDAWRGQIDPNVLRAAMADTPVCAKLFTFRCHLDRHARHYGLWTSEGNNLAADHELHAGAHHLAMRILPHAERALRAGA
jgi:hypothetical protein